MPTKKEIYQLTKEMLYAKFDGLCALCGHELGERWHIWDIEPRITIVTWKGDIILGNDSYENKLPACISCNSTRLHACGHIQKATIEQFRDFLYHEHEFLKESTYYRKMLRYGLIKETGNPIIFHFESQSL